MSLDPSLSQGQIEAVPVTVARERGVIPEASNEALQAFRLHNTFVLYLSMSRFKRVFENKKLKYFLFAA